MTGGDAIVRDGVSDHGRDALRVATAVVAQRLGRVDIEAGTGTRRVGVDDYVTVCIRKGRVLGTAEVGLSRTRAVVNLGEPWRA